MAMGGTVKFFNGERGYGFIKPDDGGRDVFVHITAVERAGLKSLVEGQRISFDVEPDKKGKGPLSAGKGFCGDSGWESGISGDWSKSIGSSGFLIGSGYWVSRAS